MDMVQENSDIKVYINGTEIEVTATGIQYPPKNKDDIFIYRYTIFDFKTLINIYYKIKKF